MVNPTNITVKFDYAREAGQNPYCGFVSFQHFRGEKLYSDIVVKPENKMCETENVECYPVPDDVPENGRGEGYYPDSSVVYIRILWKEFEGERGVYNYKFIEDILEAARAHGQTVLFRLMAHSTRARDDVPEWLKSLIPCPERPDGMRVKDSPTDPLFIDLFCEAVKALGARFDDDKTLDAVDISLPGSWGEGHKLELYSAEQLKQLVDAYLSVFKHTRLIGQLTRPELLKYAQTTAKVGWRGDGLGEPNHTEKRYPPFIEQISDLWKTAPVSFESYWWLGEWQRKGWDIDPIIEKTLEWHISTFNGKSIPAPYEWQDKIDFWVSKMGYHYTLRSAGFVTEARAGEGVNLHVNIENVGVAPIYRPAELKVRIVGNGIELVAVSETSLEKWIPGLYGENFHFRLPSDLPSGTYSYEVCIMTEAGQVFLANELERDNEWYKFGELFVQS